MNYECNKPFISMKDKLYRDKEIITEKEYLELTLLQQKNFKCMNVHDIFTPILNSIFK